MTLADQAARDRIRGDLGSTLVVEAAAGTGKTTELVGRVLSLIRTGTTALSRIVAVTFTEKAAGEMKLRLRGEIEQARDRATADSQERKLLDGALSELEAAKIGTIHGFCADLLRERAVEARVDPLFEVAAEDDFDRMYTECFDRWFEKVLADPKEGVRRALRRRPRDRDSTGPREMLSRAGKDLVEQRDFDAPWRRDRIDRVSLIDAVVARIGDLGAWAARAVDAEDYLVKNLADAQRWSTELRAREAVRRGRDHDGVEAELRVLRRKRSWEWKGSQRGFATRAERSDALALRDAVRSEIDQALDVLEADLAACLHAELASLVVLYEDHKRRAGKLDFLDLLLVARNLLRDQPALRNELQSNVTHVLVDEFQDTDPLQADILLLLAAADPEENDPARVCPTPGKLFVVGDPKQSVYRFRRADVAFYETVKRRLLAAGAELVHLSTSFRSVPSIQNAVNAAFEPLMRGSEDGSQASYVPLLPCRQEPEGRPTVVALPVPRPYADYGKIANYRIEQSAPDVIAAFVDFLIRKSGYGIEGRNVCLLFKRFQQMGSDVTRPYVRALESRRIPHVLVGGRSFHAREEVLAIRNALAAIEWPDDELSLYATLRGPFFAIGDDALLAYRHRHGRLDPMGRPDDAAMTDATREVRDALAVIGDLHVGRNRRPAADTVGHLLRATRAHAGVAIWPTGEQALGNMLRVIDLARRFEAKGAISFRSFVTHLGQQADKGAAAEAPIVEEDTDGVRIMTVHKAKGLEFPVVILADPTAPAIRQKPSRYVDPEKRLWAMPLCGCTPAELLEHRDLVVRHDHEESVRLAYVAATRARDMLVVPVVGDENVPGWVDFLHPVLYPRAADRRKSTPAPGCPAFGEDSVYERPRTAPRGAQSSVRPGLHRPALGEHGVVFWDPGALDLDRADEVGLRQQRILAADESGAVATEGERQHAEWHARRSADLRRGAEPSFVVRTVTGSPGDSAPIAVTVEHTIADRAARPRGKSFGVLLHAILATADLGSEEAVVADLAVAVGRLVGSSPEEVAAAGSAAAVALRHPLLARARESSSNCRRECPISLCLPNGERVEGVLDLAFRDTSEKTPCWVVVDFKTDVDLEPRLPEYTAQVSLYARAVAEATGEPVRAVLLSV